LFNPFTLTARTDRIDRLADGTLAILDYKSGSTDRRSDVNAGREPQLPLMGAIAEAGGFENVEAAAVQELAYIMLKGNRQGGEALALNNPQQLIVDYLRRLDEIIARYDDPRMPYRAAVIPIFRDNPTFKGDYDHLARLAEWSTGPEEPEE